MMFNNTSLFIISSLYMLLVVPLRVRSSGCYQEITVQLKGEQCSSDGNELINGPIKQGKAGPKGNKGDDGPVGDKGDPGESCKCSLVDEVINRQDYINYHHNIRFRFPRHNNVNDWVKYLPTTPQLAQWTMCLWVTMYTVAHSHLVSYAYGSMYNGVIIAVDSTNRLRADIHASRHTIDDLNFQANTPTHICVQFSQPNQKVIFYKDGLHVGTVSYKGGNNIFQGRGSLVFAQEQDSLGGGFAAGDTFDGELTNFVMWPRVLSSQEISDVTRKCKYPRDVVIRPQLDNIEWNGQTEVTLPETCPTM